MGFPSTSPELLKASGGHPSTLRRPSVLPSYCSGVPPRVPSTPTILTPVLPFVPPYPQYTLPSAAMQHPQLPLHHPPYRHVSPNTSTIQCTVPPCCAHHPSPICCSLGPQAALVSPRAELGARGRLLNRTNPLSGPWAGPTPLRPYQAPFAGHFLSNSLTRQRRCSPFPAFLLTMYMYMHICVCACVCVCICIYVYIYIYIYISSYLHPSPQL